MANMYISILVFALICSTSSYKILTISPIPSKSHAILCEGVIRELVNAGHEVTYITGIIADETIKSKNVTIVDISDNPLLADAEKFMNLESMIKKEKSWKDMILTFNMMMNFTTVTLNNINIQNLIHDDTQHFDLVIAEWAFTEAYAGFAAIYDCPYIWLSSVEPDWGIMRLIDEALSPAYTTDINSSNIPPFSFLQRVQELAFQVFGYLFRLLLLDGLDSDNYYKLLGPAITKKGRRIPPYDEIKYNASLVLGNSHVSMGIPTRVPENYKHIGGYFIRETVKPLPEDLKNIIESAKHGVIYFSLGSSLKSSSLPTQLKLNLLKMFADLKQTILWKFEEDLPNLPKNVHILKWAPQQSILAHPNVILFITHGGHLSTTESIHFGVPIIGIPVFGDQFVNVARAVNKGFAQKVELSLTMADDLKVAINEMLSDKRYRIKVKELSAIYHDRPVSPGKELVHWVEHVIRTNGAPHMRSPALVVPWYQKWYLDLLLLLVLIGFCIKYSFKFLLCKLKKKWNKKQKLS